MPPNPDGVIQEGCRYVVKADPVELQVLIEEHGLHLSTEMRHRIDSLKGENTGFTEAIVTRLPKSKGSRASSFLFSEAAGLRQR